MTKQTELQIKQLERQIYDYEQRYANLKRKIVDAAEYLNDLQEQADCLLEIGYGGESGLLPDSKRDLANAKARLLREPLPRVTWITEQEPLHPEDYVIEKVTPKRIYITRISSGGSVYYDKETGKTSYGMRALNMEKCIEDWKAWKTKNK